MDHNSAPHIQLPSYHKIDSFDKYKSGASFMKRILLALCSVASVFSQKFPIEMTLQEGHGGGVSFVCFSPDGNFFATAGSDRTVKLWTMDGRLLRTIHASDNVWCLDISPDGQSLILGGASPTVESWSVYGNHVQSFYVEGPVTRLKFFPDGNRFTFSANTSVGVLTTEGEVEFQRKAHTALVTSLDISPDGKQIVSGSEDFKIMLWDVASHEFQTFGNFGNKISEVRFSPDGKEIAVSGWRNVIQIFSSNGKIIRTLYNPSENIYSLVFSRDGKTLLSAGYDKMIRVWSTEGKLTKAIPSGHKEAMSCIALSPDEKNIISTSYDHTFKIWDRTGLLQKTLGEAKGPGEGGHWIQSVAMTPDEKYFISGSWDKQIRIWSSDGSLIKNFKGHDDYIIGIAIIGDGKHFASGDADGNIKTWDLEGKLISNWKDQVVAMSGLRASPDGKKIITCANVTHGEDGRVRIWDIATGKILRSMSGHKGVNGLDVSGDKIISGGNYGEVKVWDYNGKLLKSMSHGDYGLIESVTISPDGKYFASLSCNDIPGIRLWDSTGKFIRDLNNIQNKNFGQIVFSPDGRRLAATAENAVKIWTPGGSLIQTFEGHSNFVNTLCFSRDGAKLLSGGDDATVRLWDIRNGDHVAWIADNEDWIMFTKEGYFDASRNGGKFVAMVQGLSAYGIDQFSARYNRPDSILKQFKLGSNDLNEHFYRRYQIRLKRLGLTEEGIQDENLQLPTAVILESKQNGKNFFIRAKFSDSKNTLSAYQVFANDVPVSIASEQWLSGHDTTIEVNVTLQNGSNKIEIGCTNRRGTESYRPFILADYQEKKLPELYFLGFGVSKYQDSTINLKYAAKDVLDLESTFKKMNTGFANVRTRIYLDQGVSSASFDEAKMFLDSATTEDIVILFIAGHGMYSAEADASYYYLAYNSEWHHPEKTAIAFERIESLFQNLSARKKLFLMDTCESGEKEEEGASGGAIAGKKARSVRGFKLAQDKPNPHWYKKNRFIYNDLLRRSGTIVFSSSQGSEFSYESDEIQNGYFTEYIIRGLKSGGADRNGDGKVTTDELREYVSNGVPKATQNQQHPTVDRDNLYSKFYFPVVRP